jgi:hypothetical protein
MGGEEENLHFFVTEDKTTADAYEVMAPLIGRVVACGLLWTDIHRLPLFIGEPTVASRPTGKINFLRFCINLTQIAHIFVLISRR